MCQGYELRHEEGKSKARQIGIAIIVFIVVAVIVYLLI
jgi:hypothetical protein